MESERPLVSIITVVYNGAKYLESAILSVIDQSYDRLEYIVIDGGSTDESVDIIKKYEDRISYWVSEPDEGIYNAMNKGINKASGDIVGILNADDFFLEGTLEKVVNAFLVEEADLVHGEMQLINPNTHEVKEHRRPKPWKLRYDMYMNHPTIFIRSDIYSSFQFNEEFRIAADYDLILRLKLAGKKFHFLPSVLTKMRLGGLSEVQSTNTKQEVYEIRKKNMNYFQFQLTNLVSFGSRMIKKLIP